MEAEEAVKIDCRVFSVLRTWNRNRRAHGIVRLLTVWNDDVQSVGCAALKEHHQSLLAVAECAVNSVSRPSKKTWDNSGTNQSHGAALHEYPSCNCHFGSSVLRRLTSLKFRRTQNQSCNQRQVWTAGLCKIAFCRHLRILYLLQHSFVGCRRNIISKECSFHQRDCARRIIGH